MSRRCKSCLQPFRPDGKWQAVCWTCWRQLTAADRDAQTDPNHVTERSMNMESNELAVREPEVVEMSGVAVPVTLFGTADPRVALERMADVATALVDVIENKRLYATINGRRHITCEGWTTLGGMLGVVPVVTETRPNDTGDGIVARVEARTLDGRIVGAAEAECSRAERTWKSRDPFALRSMAQTRAISRALRAPLGQIVVLAGYEPASAEEMPADTGDQPVSRGDGKIPPELRPTKQQISRLTELLTALAEQDPGTDWVAKARELAGVDGAMLTGTLTADLIYRLERELAA